MTTKAEKRSGSYSTRVSLTDSDTGRRIQPRITARTKKELDAKVVDLKSRWNNGSYIDPSTMPLSEYLADWLEKTTGKDATRLARDSIIRNHFQQDRLGSVPLGRLKRSHVQDFVDRKARECSPRHVGLIFSVLRRALRRAVILGVIPTSPCESIELPKHQAQPVSVFDEAQTRRFVSETEADELHAAWVLMVTIGLRRGEIIGLRWNDIDLSRGTLSVNRTQTRTADGRWIVGESAKSASSHRTVQLPDVCQTALRSHRVRQLERRLMIGSAWPDTNAVFDDGRGNHLSDPERLVRRFHGALKTLALPRIRVHDLRHTAATNALRRGVPVHVVAAMLGHANPAITLQVYAHVLADMQLDAASRIDAIFTDVSERAVGE